MNPSPQKYSVLVLDNASIHKNDKLKDICQEKGIIIEFLPVSFHNFFCNLYLI